MGKNRLPPPPDKYYYESLSPHSATVPHKLNSLKAFCRSAFPPSRPWTYINHYFILNFSFSPEPVAGQFIMWHAAKVIVAAFGQCNRRRGVYDLLWDCSNFSANRHRVTQLPARQIRLAPPPVAPAASPGTCGGARWNRGECASQVGHFFGRGLLHPRRRCVKHKLIVIIIGVEIESNQLRQVAARVPISSKFEQSPTFAGLSGGCCRVPSPCWIRAALNLCPG